MLQQHTAKDKTFPYGGGMMKSSINSTGGEEIVWTLIRGRIRD